MLISRSFTAGHLADLHIRTVHGLARPCLCFRATVRQVPATPQTTPKNNPLTFNPQSLQHITLKSLNLPSPNPLKTVPQLSVVTSTTCSLNCHTFLPLTSATIEAFHSFDSLGSLTSPSFRCRTSRRSSWVVSGPRAMLSSLDHITDLLPFLGLAEPRSSMCMGTPTLLVLSSRCGLGQGVRV